MSGDGREAERRARLTSTRKGTTVQRPDYMANHSRHQGKQMVTSVPYQRKDAVMDGRGGGEQHGQQISRDSFRLDQPVSHAQTP